MKIHSYLAGIPPSALVCVYRHLPRRSRKRRRNYKRQWLRAAAMHTMREYLWCMPGLRVFIEHRRADKLCFSPVGTLGAPIREAPENTSPIEQNATATRSQRRSRVMNHSAPPRFACVPPSPSA